MKTIIFYASAGAGHRKAAEALFNYYNNQSQNVQLIDALDKTNFVFKHIYTQGYLLMINHAMWIWKFLFWITSLKTAGRLIRPLILFFNLINSQKLVNFLISEQPDVIISTHFLPPEIAGYLEKRNKIKSKLITVITDFGVHPFWITKETDIYITASEFTKTQLIQKGINTDKIKSLGIPIGEKFTKEFNKEMLFKKMGLLSDKFTVLITTGSFGIGPVEEITALLYKEVQIAVVCAKNKKLYSRLISKNYPNVKVYGFIDNIEELMVVSDMVIAKPGGLTISEILSMELAPIFISPIPGQETNNMAVLKSYGIGELAVSTNDVFQYTLEYRNNTDKLNKIKEKIRKIKQPFAAREIYNALC
ncbi:MAG: glycosyltransferase [Candidatus Omnitrophota bacterium]